MIVLIVEGLSVNDYIKNVDNPHLTQFKNIFKDNILEFLSASSYGSKTSHELSLFTSKSGDRKRSGAPKVQNAFFNIKDVKTESKSAQQDVKLRLLMNISDMNEEGYPLPGMTFDKDLKFRCTKEEYLPVNSDSPMFSIDCEMCITERQVREVTSICVVDSDLNVRFN